MSTVKTRTAEQRVLMQVRRLGLGRNPLRRGSDRAEALVLWCGLLVALLLIPFAAAAGMAVRDASETSAGRQRAVLQEVQARTLEASERAVPAGPGDVLSRVRVRYVDGQGVTRETTAAVAIGTSSGSQVSIWLNSAGEAVTGPRSPGDSAMLGAWAGFSLLLVLWLVLWGIVRLLCLPLDRRRAQEWDAGWREVAPRWIRGQK